jgi:single-strand DNA-binding protein
MAYDNTVTIVGNMTRDPELRYTASGIPVTEFGVAWNTKDKQGNESVSFFDITCWRELAEHVAESLGKGMRVIVHGRLDQNTWETKDGDKRSKVRVMAEDVGPSLRWAIANVDRLQRAGSDSTWRPVGDGKSAMERDGFPADEEPF